MKQSALVLGIGAPNLSASGRKTMCAILLGEAGLFRVYPIDADRKFPLWSKVEVDIERPKKDSRTESMKLLDFTVTGQIKDACEKRELLDQCVLMSGVHDPIDYQNTRNRSICMIKPEPHSLGAAIYPKDAIPDEDWVFTKENSGAKPYVIWRSVQGKDHKSHIVSREAYETIRRNPSKPFDLFTNMGIGNSEWDFWVLLGNMNNRRNVWCAVHVHRMKNTSGHSAARFTNLLTGRPEGWPYCSQEASNAPVRGNQLLMFAADDV